MTALVAGTSLFPAGNGRTGFLRGAVPVSMLLHALLIGGAALALNLPRTVEDNGVEAIAVDIVTLEEFSSSTTSTAQSSATDAMQSAGATPVSGVEPDPVAVERPVEAAIPVAAVAVATAEPSPPQPAAVTPATPVVERVASLMPLAAVASSAAPVEAVVPLEVSSKATTVAPSAPPETTRPLVEHFASLAPETLKPLPEAKAAKREKPVERAEKPQPARKPSPAAGNGGKSSADAAASASASAGKGKSGADGNAAADRYKGLVERQVRRALRKRKGTRGEVHVRFLVSASGAVSSIAVVKSSGKPEVDQAGIATVERAAPFPPIPPEAGRSSWDFTIPLTFTR